MTVGSDAPSSKPSPLLHFTLDPLRHKLDAQTRANKSRALTNAHVSANYFSPFAAMLVAMCFKKCSASLWRSPSTDVTKGVNLPRLSSTASLYSFFFSRAPVSKIDSGVQCRCDGASVSMTFISNNASTWGVQTPRMTRSALNPGPSALDSASLTIGSRTT